MLINYRAFSWTYTAEQLKEVFIKQMTENLSRSLAYTTEKLGDDPDYADILDFVGHIKSELAAGRQVPPDWSDILDWSWQVYDNDPAVGGSYGKATYYAKIKDGVLPATASEVGNTKILIDREKLHLDLDIDIVV